ncbi:MAG: FAD-dependent monooxygenase [Panacagrimonas sp.]
MKIAVVGGGPSGLYFALLARTYFPNTRIDVYEQNASGATYGFGIVLADRGLTRMEQAHPASAKAILDATFATRHQVITHSGQPVFIERNGYGGAIARLRLLEILETHCTDAGIHLHYDARVDVLHGFEDCDLVVGADGVNSAVRGALEQAFGTTSWDLTNRIAWYGTTRHFPYPILSFKRTPLGHFWTAAYAYTERMSTFVAECDHDAWVRSGLAGMSDEERTRFAETMFAEELEGHALIGNKSAWRCLPVIRNQRWSVGRYVLIGDALHSAHPTIGSGTRIAMEDAVDLAEALRACEGRVPAALKTFERVRKPMKQKLVDAAEKSFTWYEGVGAKLDALGPEDFVFDFMTRTGRISESRLRGEFPRFMARYENEWETFKRSAHGAVLMRERGLA